jgi:hypothetical protein
MSTVPRDKLGTAAAMIATFRNLGLVTGTGLATTVFDWRYGLSHSFIPSFHFVLGMAAILALAGALCALIRREEH